MNRDIKPGVESSEFREVRRAKYVALAVLGIGVALTLVGGYLGLWFVVFGGVGLAYVGGEVLEKTVAAYAHSRGAVKASATAPPTTVVSPSVKVGAGRL
jgi:hypothetical protein